MLTLYWYPHQVLKATSIAYAISAHTSQLKFERQKINTYFNRFSTMAEIFIAIENKYFGGEHNIVATFKLISCIDQCIFVYSKWPWLLHLFA